MVLPSPYTTVGAGMEAYLPLRPVSPLPRVVNSVNVLGYWLKLKIGTEIPDYPIIQ